MHWPAWTCCLCNTITLARDQYPQGAWRKRKQYCRHAVKRFFKAGIGFSRDCISIGMVGHACMAAEFCLPNQYVMVDIFSSWTNCCNDCFANNQLPGNKGSLV